ncbi:MAG: helix-turn-helix domain-containing protein [Calditrichaeota bacterium]|nr:helix-turn-helix domain-containing protein [Calditrichota bacterium]
MKYPSNGTTYLSRKEAAQFLQVSVQTLDRYVQQGFFPVINRRGMRPRFELQDLKDFLEKSKHYKEQQSKYLSQAIQHAAERNREEVVDSFERATRRPPLAGSLEEARLAGRRSRKPRSRKHKRN